MHDVNPQLNGMPMKIIRFLILLQEALGMEQHGNLLNKRFDRKLILFDADWGIRIIAKNHNIGNSIERCNYFFEYKDFDKNRKIS